MVSRGGFTVRILRSGRSDPVGMGLVVEKRHIVTCAHVINAALGRDQRAQERPGQSIRVQVDFPLLGGAEAPSKSCRVVEWKPPPLSGVKGGDVAGLELNDGELPLGADPARLIEASTGVEAFVFGHPLEPVPRPDGVWVRYQVVGPASQDRIQLELNRESSFRAQRGYSGSPVVVADGDGDAVVGILTVTSEVSSDVYAVSKAGLEVAWPDQLAPVPPCPYRGLAPFQAQDAEAGLFVGREDETDQLRAKVNDHTLVIVVGPSGVGKSSLVSAGLIPALLPTGQWVTASFQPGETPFTALAMALYELESSERKPSIEELHNRGQQLRDHGLAALTNTLRVALKGKRILLHVDQLEEIFTVDPDKKKEAATFLNQILSAGYVDNQSYRLVCTLRVDFLGHVLTYPDVGHWLQDRLLTLSPMGPLALERAIIEPARMCQVTYESGLAQQIAMDAAGGDGGLPLLQFALTQLWPRQHHRRLTFAHYYEFGRVEGALDRYAETIFAELKPHWSEAQIRRVMLACVRSHGDAALATRCTLDKDSSMVTADWDLVTTLVDRRLLTLGADPLDRTPIVELAHEALIRSWTRLRNWVDADADFRRWLTIMQERKENELLHDYASIAEAERWLAERSTEIPRKIRELVARSKHARRRKRITLIVIIGVIAGAIGFGSAEGWTAHQQRIEAQSRMVADEADQAGAADPSLAMQLSLAAYRITPTLEARGSLLRASALHAATRLLGHSGAFNTVAISPDGHTLAAGSTDQVVRLYDLNSANGQEPAVLSSLTDHIGAITAVAFSPDGQTLASGSDDNTIRLWNLTNPRHPVLLAVLIDHPTTATSAIAVTAVAFNPDGHLLATASTNHTAQLWDLNDIRHPTALAPLTGHNSSVNTVAFSPDGHTVVSGSDDRTVQLWDVSDPHHPAPEATLTGHTDSIHAVAFSPDGHTVASASRDNTVRLWDVSDPHHPTPQITLTGPTVSVATVAFSPDGHQLASGSEDGLVRLWDLTDARHPIALAPRSGHTNSVNAVTFTPGGHTLASGGSDGTVRLWNLTAPDHPPLIFTESLNTPLNINNPLDAVAFNPDGRTLASGGNDRLVRLWDLTDPRYPTLSHVLSGLPSFIEALAFNRSGHTLAIADGDNTIRLWDLTDPHKPIPAATLAGHTSIVESVAFSPDGHTLASSSSDHTIRLWDLTDSQHPTALATLTGHTNVVEWVAFSPDGHTLASGSDDRTVRLWDIDDPQHPTATQTLTGHTDNIEMVAFSPDGHTLASAGQDGTVRLWDLTDFNHPTAAATLTGHTARVEAVTFSPDGHTLASASFDGTVRLWDLTDSQHPAIILNHSGQVEGLAFTPDGHTLASGSFDGTIRLWDTSPDESAQDICALIATPLTPAQWQQYIPEQSYHPPCGPR